MNSTKLQNRIKRHKRVRSTVKGSQSVPRVSVFRSNKYIYVQLIDDKIGKTLMSANDIKSKLEKQKDVLEVAKTIGETASKAGISQVVFDRGGYKYHGRVKALAEALRKVGLKF